LSIFAETRRPPPTTILLARREGASRAIQPSKGAEVLTNIKSDLEKLGSALEHLIKLTFFIKGSFPDGGVLSSPNFQGRVIQR
jgi:hypothetical protein